MSPLELLKSAVSASPGHAYRLVVSVWALVAIWGGLWAQGSRPIPSMVTLLRFLGISKVTWLTNAEAWWHVPGHAALVGQIGVGAALLGALGAFWRPLADIDSTSYPTTLLGLLLVWQSCIPGATWGGWSALLGGLPPLVITVVVIRLHLEAGWPEMSAIFVGYTIVGVAYALLWVGLLAIKTKPWPPGPVG